VNAIHSDLIKRNVVVVFCPLKEFAAILLLASLNQLL
jgi:hypothetical protein